MPRRVYFRPFSSWHAGDRLRRLPIGVWQFRMTLRNWRVFWRPRRLEFHYMSDGFAPKSPLAFLKDEKFQRAYDRMILATPPAVPRASSSRVSALGSYF